MNGYDVLYQTAQIVIAVGIPVLAVYTLYAVLKNVRKPEKSK